MTEKANQWPLLSLDQLPEFAGMVEDFRQDTEEVLAELTRAKEKPWMVPEEILHRTIKVFSGERLEILENTSRQIARWREDPLAAPNKLLLDLLESTTLETEQLTHTIVGLARELAAITSDERSDSRT